jgi:uncharacterized protein
LGPEADIAALLGSTLSYCRAVAVDNSSLIGTLFLAGLAGGATHCLAMCGPFVMSQVTSRLENAPAPRGEWGRLTGAALLPYQAGRATTYTLLGVVMAGSSAGLITIFAPLAPALLIVAALFFAWQAWRSWRPAAATSGNQTAAGLPGGLQRLIRRLLADPRGLRGYGLGLALGFLPCGLLYGALAGAAGSANALAGGLAMAAFAVGTMPALIGVGFMGDYLRRQSGLVTTWLAPSLMLFNAIVLVWLACGMIQGQS